MAWPKIPVIAVAAAMATLLVAAPSGFAAEGEQEAKAEAAHAKHAKKEHPKEHPDPQKRQRAKPLRLEAFALEHGGHLVASVIAEMLPEGSRVAFHDPTGKLVVLTDNLGMERVYYLIAQLDVPPSRDNHHRGHEHGELHEHDDHDGEGEEEDCDEYPEDGDEAEGDDDGEEGASSGSLTKEALAIAIKAHIEDATKAQGGAFHVEDAKAGITLELTLDKVHEERLATMGNGVYFACSDFKAANGKVYDVDFFMKDHEGGLVMTELHIHKEDGVARYTWHENNGLWSRREVQ